METTRSTRKRTRILASAVPIALIGLLASPTLATANDHNSFNSGDIRDQISALLGQLTGILTNQTQQASPISTDHETPEENDDESVSSTDDTQAPESRPFNPEPMFDEGYPHIEPNG